MKKILLTVILLLALLLLLCACEGKSAYDIAVENGFQGTEQEWLESLKGAQGEKGEQGEQGQQGVQGEQGNPVDENPQGLDFYPLPNGTYAVAAGNAIYLNTINIPDFYNGKPVTKIKAKGFADAINLTEITIPSTVTSIDNAAFEGCTVLESISLPFVGGTPDATDHSRHFGYIFGFNTSSESSSEYHLSHKGLYYTYNIPSTLKTVTITGNDHISDRAFCNCSGLTSITIPNSVTSIGSWAFEKCSELTSITIPNSVTSIGSYAFSNCSSLNYTVYQNGKYLGNSDNPYLYLADVADASVSSFTIPTTTRFIGSYAFSGCSSLNYTVYQNGKYLGNSDNPYLYLAGVVDTSVTSFAISTTTRFIGPSAFSDCDSLESITIPSSVTSIGDYAFYNCYILESITIPEGVTSIGYGAFYNCSLQSITIPSSVTTISSRAFYKCGILSSVTFENKTGWKAGGIAVTVTDDLAANATLLKQTYYNYTWTRE